MAVLLIIIRLFASIAVSATMGTTTATSNTTTTMDTTTTASNITTTMGVTTAASNTTTTMGATTTASNTTTTMSTTTTAASATAITTTGIILISVLGSYGVVILISGIIMVACCQKRRGHQLEGAGTRRFDADAWLERKLRGLSVKSQRSLAAADDNGPEHVTFGKQKKQGSDLGEENIGGATVENFRMSYVPLSDETKSPGKPEKGQYYKSLLCPKPEAGFRNEAYEDVDIIGAPPARGEGNEGIEKEIKTDKTNASIKINQGRDSPILENGKESKDSETSNVDNIDQLYAHPVKKSKSKKLHESPMDDPSHTTVEDRHAETREQAYENTELGVMNPSPGRNEDDTREKNPTAGNGSKPEPEMDEAPEEVIMQENDLYEMTVVENGK
ncbi:uncharacterized protein LOC106158944 [Lingula anatina]|uniref:Uncharacterized protein LOC106158944 n=1 Tax=Lingula anatina TaxID=7574 RepID=A0A1S3HWV7_LINAN|nr:uncharacterized protein LOC106158944 [Lingula anatina]|eukprot:XP_013390527.1 uncharacterized protein LOC106158944 [Lingula anatina]